MIQRILDLARRNGWLTAMIVLALLLLVGTAILYMQRQSADTALDKANKEATVAKSSLVAARDQYNVDKLRAQEAALKAAPDVPSKWPSSLPIINLSELLSEGAAKYYVTINSVTPGPSGSRVAIEGKDYHAYKIDVSVTAADRRSIISFIEYIEAGPFTSLKTEGLNLSLDAAGLKWQGQFTVVVVSEG